MSRAACVLLLALSVSGGRASAQDVQGLLRNDAGDPVGGVMVMLLAAEDRVVHAAITEATGRFVLRAPRAGEYRLRAEGIGYATVTHGPLQVDSAGVSDLDLRIAVQPVSLAALAVDAASQCRVRPDEGMPAYVLWEEASKALRSAALLQDLELIEYTVATYERNVSLTTARVHNTPHDAVRVRGRPFDTLSPAELADDGYVRVEADEVLYHGPDAHVLLSDDFLDTHCIRAVRRGAERPGLVGIAFEPVPGRTVADIEGVLWIDERSGDLQYLTYDYTGLDSPRIAPGTGRVEFARLDGGGWIIQRWWIRMLHTAPARTDRNRRVTQGYLEMGGEVTDAVRIGR